MGRMDLPAGAKCAEFHFAAGTLQSKNFAVRGDTDSTQLRFSDYGWQDYLSVGSEG